MLRIGLTGGIGSGKSAVRDLLGRKGARIFDADAVAKQLMVEDAEVKTALHKVLGDRGWLKDGSLNRRWIAERLFSDAELRGQVNAIVHPAVHAAFVAAADRAKSQGVQVFVREAALLPPPDQRAFLDRLVAVTAPKGVRIRRVMERDGLTYSDVEARMQAQPRDEDYAAVADDVITNGGTIVDLSGQVDVLWNEWMDTEGGK